MFKDIKSSVQILLINKIQQLDLQSITHTLGSLISVLPPSTPLLLGPPAFKVFYFVRVNRNPFVAKNTC